MRLNKFIAAMTTSALLLAGCSQTPKPTEQTQSSQSQSKDQSKTQSSQTSKLTVTQQSTKAAAKRVNRKVLIQKTSAQAKKTFEEIAQQSLNRQAKRAQLQSNLRRLKNVKTSLLDRKTLLSYQVLKHSLESKINASSWYYHGYPVNQVKQRHLYPVYGLLNKQIKNQRDAQSYIERLYRIKQQMLRLTQTLRDRELKGIMPPYFVFEQVIDETVVIISGAPFEQGEDSPLLRDFKEKLSDLAIDTKQKEQLITEAELALTTKVKSGYSTLISYLREQQSRASHDDGVWKLPQGSSYYQQLLQQATTSSLTATQLHRLGLSEIIRIHSEIRNLMANSGFTGDLNQYFEFMRSDQQFNFTRSAQRNTALATTTAYLNKNIMVQLKEILTLKVDASFNPPQYVASKNTGHHSSFNTPANAAKYQLAASLVHHQFLGHSLQAAVSKAQPDLAGFRQAINYAAFAEGWALYSERLAQQLNFYQHPNDNLGRLAFELWHASLLVIDTGIHSQQWTREMAIEYLTVNSPAPVATITKAVEHSIVSPAQATAAFVGMLAIVELRQEAQQTLANKFDLREFHDVLLKNGQLPLNLLRQQVNTYIKAKK